MRTVFVNLLQGLWDKQDACWEIVSELKGRLDASGHSCNGSPVGPDTASSQEVPHRSNSAPRRTDVTSNQNPSSYGADSPPSPPSAGGSDDSGFVSEFGMPRPSGVEDIGPPSSIPSRCVSISGHPFGDHDIRSTSSPVDPPAHIPRQCPAVPARTNSDSNGFSDSQPITTVVCIRALEMVYPPPARDQLTPPHFPHFRIFTLSLQRSQHSWGFLYHSRHWRRLL